MLAVNYGTQFRNLPDANYGQQSPVTLGLPVLPLPFLSPSVQFRSTEKQGFGVDLNHDNRYTKGQDAILAMDLNRNGSISDGEIQRSRTLLNAYSGNFDMNNDGQTSDRERAEGSRTQREAQSLLGSPGCMGVGISVDRFAAAGGKVLIDRDRNGSFSLTETHDPYNVPGCGEGRALTNVNPGGNTGIRSRDQLAPSFGRPIGLAGGFQGSLGRPLGVGSTVGGAGIAGAGFQH